MKLARVVLTLPMVFGLFILLYLSSGDVEKFAKVDLDKIEEISISFDNSNIQTISNKEDMEFITNKLKTYKLRRIFSLSKVRQVKEIYRLILVDGKRGAVLQMEQDNILSISPDGKRYHDFKLTGDILSLEEILEIYNSY